jgi:hypothetical protein
VFEGLFASKIYQSYLVDLGMKRAMRDRLTRRSMILIASSIWQLKNKLLTDENLPFGNRKNRRHIFAKGDRYFPEAIAALHFI